MDDIHDRVCSNIERTSMTFVLKRMNSNLVNWTSSIIHKGVDVSPRSCCASVNYRIQLAEMQIIKALLKKCVILRKKKF